MMRVRELAGALLSVGVLWIIGVLASSCKKTATTTVY
jgi:hypothetical protein